MQGPVSIRVFVAGTSYTSPFDFNYDTARIDGFAPRRAPTVGGTLVTIRGSNFGLNQSGAAGRAGGAGGGGYIPAMDFGKVRLRRPQDEDGTGRECALVAFGHAEVNCTVPEYVEGSVGGADLELCFDPGRSCTGNFQHSPFFFSYKRCGSSGTFLPTHTHTMRQGC
jgi:hypothetical protein